MRMSSLKNRIELLENDLKADPPRISVYHDLPFAIFRYDPEEEWKLRGRHGCWQHGWEKRAGSTSIIQCRNFFGRPLRKPKGSMQSLTSKKIEDSLRLRSN